MFFEKHEQRFATDVGLERTQRIGLPSKPLILVKGAFIFFFFVNFFLSGMKLLLLFFCDSTLRWWIFMYHATVCVTCTYFLRLFMRDTLEISFSKFIVYCESVS